MAPSHEMVPMRLGFADVLGARTLGALALHERHLLARLQLIEGGERLRKPTCGRTSPCHRLVSMKPKPLSV